MKAIVLTDYGVPGYIKEQKTPVPEINENQILVEVFGTSINPADISLRSGAIQHFMPTQFPHLLGVDIVGIVKDIGKNITHVKPGDRVMGVSLKGAYAEYVAVEEREVVVLPKDISFKDAAGLPAVGMTAWIALFQYADLQPKQRILIHGGAGGVAHIAIQLAKQHGAYVITTAREYNHEFVKSLGADEVIDYTTTDFTKAISSPVDIVLDTIMDKNFTGSLSETGQRSYDVLKDDGKLISLVAMALDKQPQVRRIESKFTHVQPSHEVFISLLQRVQEQKLKVHVDKEFPFTLEGIIDGYNKSQIQPRKGKLIILKNLD